MKDVNYSKLFAAADYKMAVKNKDVAKQMETMSSEMKERTNNLATSIQTIIVNILNDLKEEKGWSYEYGEFSKYGEPKRLEWNYDGEKLTITIDFSYETLSDSMYIGPRGFDFKEEISWPYLKERLKSQNIMISRKKLVEKEKAGKNGWYDTTRYTDIITITLGREDKKVQKPTKAPQKKK